MRDIQPKALAGFVQAVVENFSDLPAEAAVMTGTVPFQHLVVVCHIDTPRPDGMEGSRTVSFACCASEFRGKTLEHVVSVIRSRFDRAMSSPRQTGAYGMDVISGN